MISASAPMLEGLHCVILGHFLIVIASNGNYNSDKGGLR